MTNAVQRSFESIAATLNATDGATITAASCKSWMPGERCFAISANGRPVMQDGCHVSYVATSKKRAVEIHASRIAASKVRDAYQPSLGS